MAPMDRGTPYFILVGFIASRTMHVSVMNCQLPIRVNFVTKADSAGFLRL